MPVKTSLRLHVRVEPGEQQRRGQQIGRVAARGIGEFGDDQHAGKNRRQRQRAGRAQPQQHDGAEQQHRKHLHRLHGGDRRHHLAQGRQHFGIEEFDAVHRQHGMERRRIVGHARAEAAAIVGQRQIVALGDFSLDRAIGIVVQRLRRRIGVFLGDREIGQHVPVGVGQDHRRQRRQQDVERKADDADAHGKARIKAAAGRQRAVGQAVDRICLRGRPAQHRRISHCRPGSSRNP